MVSQYLLGVDAGTSIIKAVVFDLNGQERGVGRRKLPVKSPRPGWAEQDMDVVWKATTGAIRSALEQAGANPDEITAVGVCGQGDGAWLIDEAGGPVRPAALWNDNRAVEIIERWQNDGTLKACYRILGTVLWPGSLAALLDWLRVYEPDNFARIRWAFCCKDWLNYRLTGVVGTDESDGTIPFSSIEARHYDERLLRMLGFERFQDNLPPIRQSAAILGHVLPRATWETGLLAGTPVAVGSVDVYSNALGVGVTEPGQSLAILGTTSVAAVVMDQPDIRPLDVGATVCHSVPGRWVRALGTMTGTPNLDWFLDQFGIRGLRGQKLYAACNSMVAESPPGARGVVYLPFLKGERAPFLQPSATAGFFGMTHASQRSDLLRAIYEGVAFSLRDCYTAMDTHLERVVLTGGGARSEVWCQILADILGCQIDLPHGSELGAKGAALMAGISSGCYSGFNDAIERAVRMEKSFFPEAKTKVFYDVLYDLYRDLYRSLEPFWVRRSQLFV